MSVIATRGAASSRSYGEFSQTTAVAYIEDVFSTYLYTSSGTTQTINNGIDLAGKGGLVWNKRRDNTGGHQLFDTNRSVLNYLATDSTNAQGNSPNTLTSFNSNGFNIGASIAPSGGTMVSWTFRKQAKFFDMVTYTGTGGVLTISHNLGSIPGCIIVKRTDNTGTWYVYFTGITSVSQYLELNTTNSVSFVPGGNIWGTTTPTSSVFYVGGTSTTSINGATYVAYIFAHNAGGFGLLGTDSVISCGSYVGNSSAAGPVVSLGWEPQFLLLKNADASGGNWVIVDNMRGLVASTNTNNVGTAYLYAEVNLTEGNSTTISGVASITSRGFQLNGPTVVNRNAENHIYIAIRRGPMKIPTSGTRVFAVSAGQNDTDAALTPPGFPVDMAISLMRGTWDKHIRERLVGTPYMITNKTNSESASAFTWDTVTDLNAFNLIGASTVYEMFRRAPSFFDVVCYTGDGGIPRTISHNLTVAPELIITKARSFAYDWMVGFNFSVSNYQLMYLNATNLATTISYSNFSPYPFAPTSTTYGISADNNAVNQNGITYVAYLFASCPGVSKVGSYTGNGTSQTINCDFSSGARFLLIKRTDSTGDWYVWDTARGIVTANDPHLSLNTGVAEVSSDDSIDPDSTGFIVNQLSATNINVNNATYIFLAIA